MCRAKRHISAITIVWVLSVSAACSTETWCSVVKMSPDGFVALRAGPGVGYALIERLRPYEFLWMSTALCMKDLCDENKEWLVVEGVPRIDGPLGNEQSHTKGG
jgi:hypothetical protein